MVLPTYLRSRHGASLAVPQRWMLLRSRWRSMKLRIAEVIPGGWSDLGAHTVRCSGLRYSLDNKWVAGIHVCGGKDPSSRTEQENTWGGGRERAPAMQCSTFPGHGRMGKYAKAVIKRKTFLRRKLWILLHPYDSEPIRAVQLASSKSAYVRSQWQYFDWIEHTSALHKTASTLYDPRVMGERRSSSGPLTPREESSCSLDDTKRASLS